MNLKYTVLHIVVYLSVNHLTNVILKIP